MRTRIERKIIPIAHLTSGLFSEFAAAHAAAEGLISADELLRVRVDKTVDRSA